MNIEIQIMIFILLSILFFSFNNVLWKKNLEDTSISFLISYRAFFTSIISLILFLTNSDFNNIINSSIIKITVGSIFGAIGLYCMLFIIKKSSLRWIGIYNLFGVIFTGIYLHFFENIEINNFLFGIVLIMSGFILHLYNNQEPSLKLEIKQHFYLIIMELGFGISSILHWKNLEKNVPILFIISNQEMVVFLIFSIINLRVDKTITNFKKLKLYLNRVIVMALILFFALLFSFVGLKTTNPLISSTLFLIGPILTITLGNIFFKEKITFKNLISIIIILIGAFIIHLNIV
ncbi:EamA family transporter [uncultured Flavobacterium sp.]|uniref:EamA family transporter n=1 Tax=uncultured Flavobacterium sp. TaxID=165435 RepID=UPI002627FB14|nr:EamA family transporter [uncultured Flavobacterium sp.]